MIKKSCENTLYSKNDAKNFKALIFNNFLGGKNNYQPVASSISTF